MTEILAVFSRAPETGKVKTRLSPPLTAEQALALHRALVEDTLDLLGRVERPGLEKVLLLSEPLRPDHVLHVSSNWATAVQAPGDLGARLASLFSTSFERGARAVVVLGSDSPTLPLEVIHEAFDDLKRAPVVLGPAEDGGYYLLGCSQWVPAIFQNIDWGTSQVLAQTLSALQSRNLAAELLIPWYDIDRAEDLQKLREEIAYLKRSAPHLVPVRVAAALPVPSESEYTLDTDF